MRWLWDERLKREQVAGEQAAALDRLSEKLKTAMLLVDGFERKILDLQNDLQRHIKTHRLFELAVLALAAAAGGFLSRWLIPK